MALGPKTENSVEGGNGNTQVGHNSGTIVQGYTAEQHEEALQKRLAEQKDLLERAHGAERELLEMKISQLENQLANPEHSLAEAQKRIADLEALLDREGNDIGAERIEAAKNAMEAGDYSLADGIFAEIGAREELAVKRSARAAFGRGEVAEAEIRWQDAYDHYKRAAQLHETLKHLRAYAHMAWRLAKGQEAVEVEQKLVDLVGETHGEDSSEYATQLNNLGEVLRAQGQYAQAEKLFREAIAIGAKTIGTAHPDYAIDVSNLAGVLHAQGQYAEAEKLCREALEIDAKTIGTAHPNYATDLNNLAGVLRAQGQYAEAEKLFREALDIAAKTIGSAHPDYATHLNNLAEVLAAQGQYAEAEKHCRQAIEIWEARLGAEHPHTLEGCENLEILLAQSRP